MAPVSRLSLSEAFLLQRPDFILRSQRRERRVREMSEIRRERRRRTLLNKAGELLQSLYLHAHSWVILLLHLSVDYKTNSPLSMYM